MARRLASFDLLSRSISRTWFALLLPVTIAGACAVDDTTESRSSGGGEGGSAASEGSGGGGSSTVGTTGSGGHEPADAGLDSDGATFDCVVSGVPGNCMDASACEAQGEYAPIAGFCPGPAEIQCCTPYGKALCDPEVVTTPNDGATTEAPGTGGCPHGMLRVATFCVDRFEASLVRVDDGSSFSPYFNPGLLPVRAVSIAGAVPQGYISGEQAEDACSNAGKRLCSDTEWLRACQGSAGSTYPYGNTEQLGVCNDHRDAHPAVQYFGTSEDWIWSELGNACLNQLPEGLAPAGAYDGCVTDEGAFDMMGNLHEWTSNAAGTFRGGFYVDTVLNGPGCLYATTAHDTAHWDYSTGFRCCAD